MSEWKLPPTPMEISVRHMMEQRLKEKEEKKIKFERMGEDIEHILERLESLNDRLTRLENNVHP